MNPAAALAPLLELADVRSALADARAAVDAALRHPALRRSGRPVSPDVMPRLSGLLALVPGLETVPTLLLAAVVHGELLALRPFAGPSGVVARAAARLTLVAGGLDPRGLLAPEVGHLAREPEYVGAANAYTTGTPDGLRAWVRHCALAVELAATEITTIADGPAA